MPELPEVETIKRGLQGLILNKKIVQVHVLTDKSWRGPKQLVEGQSVVELERRGKALLMKLSNGLWIMTHLRMTGQLIYVGDERYAAGHPDANFTAEMPSRHTRIYFDFEDGTHLYFNDLRKFGYMSLMEDDDLAQDSFLNSLGPEPWAMNDKEFYARLQRHKNAPVKAVILDQKVIAGVGNIYADEGLFLAKIYPGRLAGEVSRKEATELLKGLCEVMQRSIDSGGSTMKDYVRADGTKGSYLEKFANVFRREGKACPNCGAEIKKTRVAGRGTHFCAECQK